MNRHVKRWILGSASVALFSMGYAKMNQPLFLKNTAVAPVEQRQIQSNQQLSQKTLELQRTIDKLQTELKLASSKDQNGVKQLQSLQTTAVTLQKKAETEKRLAAEKRLAEAKREEAAKQEALRKQQWEQQQKAAPPVQTITKASGHKEDDGEEDDD